MSNPSNFSYCSIERKPCVGWVETYFKDCLCNLKDEISFACGFVSLIAWGVAEIPQIITNFINKSGHGVSLAFLLTWIVGDIFNLVGCLLEPATLPTQFYTALLYTSSTVVLVLQSIYYDYICRWWKCRRKLEFHDQYNMFEEGTKPLKRPTSTTTNAVSSSIVIPGSAPPRDFYYTSARSLASSGTPPYGSYLRPARSGPSALQDINSSDDDDNSTVFFKKPSKRSAKSNISRSAGYGTFFATSATLPFQSKALVEGHVGLSGRRLLLGNGTQHEVLGVWLGWMMAAIYMGGRIPQIWLNIKRGSVEGLNPLMFIFALTANVTYVGSILVRSTEWEKIKPNMPWLLDAIVCVALDLFIILQYAYYSLKERRRITSNGQDSTAEYYVTLEK